MPDYLNEKIAGCYLYFTSKCILEAFHAHADPNRRASTEAKFFIRKNGAVVIQKKGQLTEKQLNKIKTYIKDNYTSMYLMWKEKCLSNGIDPEFYNNSK